MNCLTGPVIEAVRHDAEDECSTSRTVCAAYGGQQLAFWNALTTSLFCVDDIWAAPRAARCAPYQDVTSRRHGKTRLSGAATAIMAGSSEDWAEEHGADYHFWPCRQCRSSPLAAVTAVNQVLHAMSSKRDCMSSRSSSAGNGRGSWRLEKLSLQPVAGETGRGGRHPLRVPLKASARHLYECLLPALGGVVSSTGVVRGGGSRGQSASPSAMFATTGND